MASQIRMQQAAKISRMGKTHFMISSSHVLQRNSVYIPCLGHVSGEYHQIEHSRRAVEAPWSCTPETMATEFSKSLAKSSIAFRLMMEAV